MIKDEQSMGYEQRVRYRIRMMAKECGLSVKELRKNMKEFEVTNDLYNWMKARISREEYSKSIEEIEKEQFYNDGDIASLAAA